MHDPAHPVRLRRIVSIAALVIAAVAASLAAAEAALARRDAERHAAPGRLIEVDGSHDHLLCHGEGGPTTVLVGGLGGIAQGWAWVQRRLAEDGRVCAHDRPGYGFSAFRPAEDDPVREAVRLADVLATAGERGPFVVVGHSLGGHYARAFASAFPDDVAGLVLVDARPPDVADHVRDHDDDVRRTASMLRWGLRLAPLGALRAFGGGAAIAATLPADVRDAVVARLAHADHTRRLVSELEALPALDAAAGHLELPDGVPALALTATDAPDGMSEDAWRALRTIVRDAAVAVPVTDVRAVEGADHVSLLTDEAHAGVVAEAIASWRPAQRGGP